jgi:hypothetical protein
MPDALLSSAAEFSTNFARYEPETSGVDVVKVVRDGHSGQSLLVQSR